MADVDEAFWNSFRAELTDIAQEIVRLKAGLRQDSPEQEHFLHRMMMACENATGAVLLGRAGLSTPLMAVARHAVRERDRHLLGVAERPERRGGGRRRGAGNDPDHEAYLVEGAR